MHQIVWQITCTILICLCIAFNYYKYSKYVKIMIFYIARWARTFSKYLQSLLIKTCSRYILLHSALPFQVPIFHHLYTVKPIFTTANAIKVACEILLGYRSKFPVINTIESFELILYSLLFELILMLRKWLNVSVP